jgi:hypothetical protein
MPLHPELRIVCAGAKGRTSRRQMAGQARPGGKLLERESDAAEAYENVALGLRESTVYGRNATGTRREFLSSE